MTDPEAEHRKYASNDLDIEAHNAANLERVIGFFSLVGLHVASVITAGIYASYFRFEALGIAAIFFIGATQLYYVLPVGWIMRGNRPRLQGFIAGAIVTALLNTGCWGMFMTSY